MSALGEAAERAASHAAAADELLATFDAQGNPGTFAMAHALLACEARLEMLAELLANLGTNQYPLVTIGDRPTRPGW